MLWLGHELVRDSVSREHALGGGLRVDRDRVRRREQLFPPGAGHRRFERELSPAGGPLPVPLSFRDGRSARRSRITSRFSSTPVRPTAEDEGRCPWQELRLGIKRGKTLA